MGAKYWIKLYHEILNDPKMGRLSDRLFRRTIELFLIAGEYNDDGLLPSIEDIAWRLKVDEEHLETEMIELQRVGILSVQNSRWLVTKFAERQAPMDKAEYMRRSREEDQIRKYYQPRYQSVTRSNAEPDTDTDTDTESEEEGTPSGFTEEEFVSYLATELAVLQGGSLNSKDADTINEWTDEYEWGWVLDALQIAKDANATSPNYITAILKRWHKQGGPDKANSRISQQDRNKALLDEVFNGD